MKLTLQISSSCKALAIIMRFFLLFLFCLMMMLILTTIYVSNGQLSDPSNDLLDFSHGDHNRSSNEDITQQKTFSTNRRLFMHGSCTNRDISISQSRDSSSGIPQYIVQIVNTCVFGCAPSNIHLHCGWFASARIVNPRTFKRLSYDDCIINGGNPLKTSQIIRFTYSNSFMYPLSFKYAKFC